MARRAQLAALLSGLLALDLILNLWHALRAPVEDLRVVPGCTQHAPDDLAALGRRVAGSERVLALTFLHSAQADEAANFLAHARSAGVLARLLAIVLDEPSAALAQRYGVAAFRVRVRGVDAARPSSAASTSCAAAEEWLDASALRAARWRYLATLTRAGVHVWVSDVRTLWLRDALSSWVPPRGCDVALASDAPYDDEPAPPRASPMTLSTGGGLRHNRSSETRMQAFDPRLSVALGLHRAVPSVSSWHLRVARRLTEAGGETEGRALSQALTAACVPADTHSWDGGVAEAEQHSVHAGADECPRWCLLPAALFPNGLQYFQQRAPQTASPRVQPHAVLASWVSQPHLEYRLREEGLWRLDDEQSVGEEAVASGERFLAFKELLINNGLSNTRNALRSALAIAELTNRTLILPNYWSRHLQGEPYRVGVDYYFDWSRLRRAFPRVREAALLARAFPAAATWPPRAPIHVHFVQLHEGEALCEEIDDTERMERLGNVNETCPPLRLTDGRLRKLLASRFHLGASEDELRAWLAPYEAEPLLYFGRMFRRFWRFASPERHDDFQRRFAWGVQPAPEIRAVAAESLQTLRTAIGGGAFNCVHMRRRDFVADHAKEETAIGDYAMRARERLDQQSRRGARLPLYLASDVAEEPETREAFLRHFGRVFTLFDIFPSWDLDAFGTMRHSALVGPERAAALAREMRFGNVDQLVCSEAEHFVGNKWSSFTHHVCFLRQQRGFRAACDQADIYARQIDSRMEYV